MRAALGKVRIDRMLVCQWGTPYETPSGEVQGPGQWTKDIGTSYRLSDDIAPGWSHVERILNQAVHIGLRAFTGPGHFADADLLEVANKAMTQAEEQTHFAFWAMAKSALVVSTKLDEISDDSRAILLNRDLIAVNQDSLGRPDRDLFAGPLQNGDIAVLSYDLSNAARSLSVDFAALGVESADVHDLYSGERRSGVNSYEANVGGHGCVALRLSNVRRAADQSQTVTWLEGESAQLGGGANSQDCAGCSGGRKAGNLGNGGTPTFNNVRVESEKATLIIDYINAEVGYLGGQSTTNVRTATVSVNGGEPVTASFPLSGYDWNRDVLTNFKLELSGFRPGQDNTVQFANPSGYAPDFDRIGVPSPRAARDLRVEPSRRSTV